VRVIVLIWGRRVTAVPGGGGRSEWERRIAAQQREAERQAKEQARLAREREKAAKEAHLLAQQGAAEAKTAAVEQQIRDLDDVAPVDPKGLARIFGATRVAPVRSLRHRSASMSP
jgi:hypothetical protein